MHLKQHIKHIVCLFVIPKAPEGRRANKRDNYESAFPAFSGIQLQRNRVFCSYSVWTFYFTNEMHLVLFPGQSLTLSRSYGHFFIHCTFQLFLIYRHDIFFSLRVPGSFVRSLIISENVQGQEEDVLKTF